MAARPATNRLTAVGALALRRRGRVTIWAHERDERGRPPGRGRGAPSTASPRCAVRAAAAPRRPRIRWRRSSALGEPRRRAPRAEACACPRAGRDFFTWDPVRRRSPNRPWRRWGTHRLVHVLLRVARDYRRAHPARRPMAVGDLSRLTAATSGRGSDTSAMRATRTGSTPTCTTHGGRERSGLRGAGQIDRRLSQELVDRFLAAGAELVLRRSRRPASAARACSVLANHDNHLHLRLGNRPAEAAVYLARCAGERRRSPRGG